MSGFCMVDMLTLVVQSIMTLLLQVDPETQPTPRLRRAGAVFTTELVEVSG